MSLLAALASTALPFLGADFAKVLASSILAPLEYGGTIEDAIEGVFTAYDKPRVGGRSFPADMNREALFFALVAAYNEARPVCTDCDGITAACPFCEAA